MSSYLYQYIQAWKAQPYPGPKYDLQKLKHLVLVDVFYGLEPDVNQTIDVSSRRFQSFAEAIGAFFMPAMEHIIETIQVRE